MLGWRGVLGEGKATRREPAKELGFDFGGVQMAQHDQAVRPRSSKQRLAIV